MAQLNKLIERLIVARVEFVLVDGFAAVAYGMSLMTQNVDVCCPFSTQNLRSIEAAIEDLKPVHRMTPQKLPFVLTDELCASLNNLYLDTDLGPLDCLSESARTRRLFRSQRTQHRVNSRRWRLPRAHIDALIAAKAATNRARDRMTVSQLKAIKERQGL